jgi:predicted nucleotidyltransferase component of viral defense system
MYNQEYENQVRLLLFCLPLLKEVSRLALKGGTAINFFIRDMPRLSVDIDLTYLPIGESREVAVANIQDDLKKLKKLIELRVAGSVVTPYIKNETILRLIVRHKGTQIKIEPSFIVRGALYEPISVNLCDRAKNEFETSAAGISMLSIPEVYAGKICATLNRQHPRDLFDVRNLLNDQGITEEIRRAFVVYLAGDARPMHELLNPNLLDIETVFKREFHRMTVDDVRLEELLKVRDTLIQKISEDLTLNERQFLLSMKLGEPEWNLLPFKNLNKLPALQWKLINVRKIDKTKHQKMVDKLKVALGL